MPKKSRELRRNINAVRRRIIRRREWLEHSNEAREALSAGPLSGAYDVVEHVRAQLQQDEMELARLEAE